MRPAITAAGFVVLWSSGFVGAVLAADAGRPSGVLAWRYLATLLVLVAVAGHRCRARECRPAAREVGQQAALGLLSHGVFLGGVFAAAGAGVGAGTTALVAAAQPMLVVLAGRLWWRDRLTGRQLAGLVVGVVAVAVTVGGADVGVGAAVLLPVASVLGLSGAALLERRWQPTIDVAVGLTIQVGAAAAAFTAYAVVVGSLADVDPSADLVAALAWLVLLSGLGGYTAFLLCLRRLGASTTSALLYLTPPVTALWAWAMFAERPTPVQLGGLALGAVAVVLVVAPRPRRPG